MAFVLIVISVSAQPFNGEFITELNGENGTFSDIIEVAGQYYTIGQGSGGVYYAKFNVDGNLTWTKTINTTPNTVVGITNIGTRIFLGYSYEENGMFPVKLMEIDPVNGDEVNGASVLDNNALDLTHFSQLRASDIHNHLFLLAGDTMVRYNPDNFSPAFSFSAPVLIQSTVETSEGGILLTHGFVNDSVTVVRRINEDTVIQSQFRYQANFGHNRKLVRVGENKYRVFTYDSDTLRTWMVNDTCKDVGDNLFWRIWTSTNPTPDETYEFEVTEASDSSFILSFKNVILFWGSQNNEGIYLIEIHEHASNHQTIAKTIEDSHGEYVFVGKSAQGHPYISKLGDGLLSGIETMGGRESRLFAFPNPSSGLVHVKDAPSNTPYQVVDSLGRKVMEGKSKESQMTIDISSLNSGIYNLVIGTSCISVCKQ